MRNLKGNFRSSSQIDIMRKTIKDPSLQIRLSIYKIPRPQSPLQGAKNSLSFAARKAPFKSAFSAQAQMNHWLSENKNLFSHAALDPSVPVPDSPNGVSLHDPAVDTNVKLDRIADLLENMVAVLNEQSDHQKKVEIWHEEDVKYSSFSKGIGIATLIATISGIIIGGVITIGIQFLAS